MALSKAEARLREERLFLLRADGLGQILAGIPKDYDVIGPVRNKWAVNYGPIADVDDLALGLKSEEGPGKYRLSDGASGFDLAGARAMNSPKTFTHRPRELLYTTRRDESGEFNYESPKLPIVKQAFFGLHACDVGAMAVLDRTFNRQFRDPMYDQRRQNTIVVGVDCFEPGNNCFCATFDTGPELKSGYDIGLSNLGDEYLVEVATDAGAAIMSETDVKPAGADAVKLKKELLAAAGRKMVKAFDLDRAVKVLNDNYDHPYWREPSARCLSCANCINVCPTCYCYQITDKSSVDLSESTRTRVWDACQNIEFAAVHGGNFRPKRMDRIRQWVNHKLSWTIEQYGCAGCVGCGRCITWCPTAIDITEPVRRIGGKDVRLVV